MVKLKNNKESDNYSYIYKFDLNDEQKYYLFTHNEKDCMNYFSFCKKSYYDLRKRYIDFIINIPQEEIFYHTNTYIEQYDLEGNLIQKFDMIKEFHNYLIENNFIKTKRIKTIRNLLKDKYNKPWNGFIFKRIEEKYI